MAISPLDILCGAQDVQFEPVLEFCDAVETTYAWDFPTASPASTSDQLIPQPVRFEKGTHTVTLTATNSCGTFTATETFEVAGDATVAIDISQDEVCLNGDNTVSVSNNSTGDISSYRWTAYGPSGNVVATSTEVSPTFTVISAAELGTYRLEALIEVAGCSDITWDTLVVVGGIPEATIEEITVDCGEDTFDPAADYGAAIDLIDSVRWVFPAGSTPAFSTELDPGEVVLATYGEDLEVSLTVFNPCGTTTVTETFDVQEPTVVDIAFDRDGVCDGESITVTNTSSGNGLTYIWSVTPSADVVISDITAAEPTITFNGGVGVYTVMATVSNGVCADQTFEQKMNVAVLPVLTMDEVDDACGKVRLNPSVDYGIDESLIDSIRWIVEKVSGVDAGSIIYSGEPFGKNFDVTEPGDYLFTAIAYNSCAPIGVSVEEPFTVLDGPPVTFTVDQDMTCFGGSITVTNTSAITKKPRFYLNDADGNTVAYESTSPATFNFPAYMAPGAYTIRLELDDKKCGTGFQETTVYLMGDPEIVLNSIPDGCGSATVNLKATHTDSMLLTGITWQIHDAAGTLVYEDNTYNPAAASLTAGNYTATATVTNNCSSDQSQRTFTITEGTAPTFELDVVESCAGGSITATNTTSELTAITFYLMDGDGNQLLHVSNSPATFMLGSAFDAGTYTVRMEGTSPDCGGSLTATELEFNVLPTPTVTIDPVADGCGSMTFTPSATLAAAKAITWEITDGGGNTVYTDASFNPTEVTLATGNYTLSVTVSNACGTEEDTVTFEITDAPTPTLSLDSDDFCEGQSVTATSTAIDLTDVAFTVLDGSGTTVASSNSSPFTFGSDLTAGTYLLRLQGNSISCGITMRLDTVITIANSPAVTVDLVADACGSITFTPSGSHQNASSIGWEIRDDSGTVVYTDDSFTPAPVSLGSGSYTLSASVTNGCGNATDAVSFVVTGDKAASISFDLDRDTRCEGEAFTVTNTSTGLNNVTFTVMDAQGNPIEQTTTSPFTFGNDLASGEYTVRMTGDSDGCSAASINKDTTVVIQSVPLVVLNPVADQCGSITFTPSARVTNASVVEWTIRNSEGKRVYTDATFDPAEVTLAKGFYTLVVEVANNCGIADDATTFEVSEGETPVFTLDTETSCEGGTITATNTTTDLNDLLFTVIDAGGNTVATSTASPFTFGDDLSLGSYTVRMEGSSNSCPSGTVATEQLISIATAPTIALASVADACGSVTFTPTATVRDATRITWEIHNGSGELIFSDDTFEPGQITLGAGSYELSASVSNACNAASDKVTFVVDPAPVPTVNLDTDNICEGNTITVSNTSGDVANANYVVTNEAGFTVASGAGASFTFGSGLIPGSYVITMQGTSNSCAGAAVSVDTTVTIRAKPVVSLDEVVGNCGSITFTPSAVYSFAEGIIWSIRNASGKEVYTDYSFTPAEVNLTPGFYTLTAVVYNDCGTDDDVTSFEVGSGTEPTFSLDTDINCEGGTFTVTNTTSDLSNLQFSVIDGSGATVASGNNSPFTFGAGLPTGEYTVRMQGESVSCSTGIVTQEATVDVVSNPTVVLDAVAESCGESDFVPSATTEFASAISWQILDENDAVVYADDQFEPKRATLPAGSYTLVAAVTNDCGSAEDRTPFVVNPGPTPNFSLSSSSVCSGGSIVATNRSTGDVSDFTFDVLDLNGKVVMSSDVSPAVFTFGDAMPVGSYTVRLTVSSATCAPVSNGTTVKLGLAPFIELNPVADQCAPAEVTLSATHSDPAKITFINWQIRDQNGFLVYNNDTFDPPAADLEEGTYFVTATVANECGVDRSRDTFRLMAPMTPVMSLDALAVCEGASFTVTNETGDLESVAFTVLDESGNPVASSDASPFVFGDGLAAGTYTVQLSGSNAACGGTVRIDTTVMINSGPSVMLDPVADACGSIDLTPSATVIDALTISWNITDATGMLVYTDDSFSPADVALGAGSYTLTAEVTNECHSDTDQVSFVVAAPDAPTFTLDTDDICEDESITVTNTSTGLTDLTFTVTNDLGGVVAAGNNSPFTFGNKLKGGTYTISMEGKSANCGDVVVSTSSTVIVRPVPTVVLETVAGSCGSYTFTPTADVADATSIAWSIRNASGLVVYTDDTFDPAAVTLGPGFYTLTVDVANDCGITDDVTTFEVTEGTAPTFNFDTDNVCEGGTFTVTNTSGDLLEPVFTVLDAAGNSVATGTASPFSFGTDLTAGTYTVRMEGTSASCPAGPVAVEREVTVATDPTVVVDPIADFCGSATFTPSATTTDATEMRWIIADANNTVLFTDESFSPGQVTLGVGSYTLTAAVSNDCGSADYVVSFTVEGGAEPAFSLDKTESCEGDTFTATNTTPTLRNARFTVIDETGVTVASGTMSPFRFGGALAPGTFTVRMDGFDSACGDSPVSVDTTIVIYPDPTVAVDPVASTCGSLTFTPSATHADASAISWKIRNAAGSLVYSDASFDPAEVMLGPGFYTLLVEVSNECGSRSDFTNFEITEGSPATFALDTDNVCEGETVTVTNTSSDLTNISFTVTNESGGVVATATSSPFTFGSDLLQGTYTVRMEGQSMSCASGTIGAEAIVVINTAPTVVLDPVTDFCGESDFTPVAATTEAETIRWEVTDVDGSVVYRNATFNPAEVNLSAGTYTLQATVTNDCGSATDQVTFVVSPAPVANFSLSSSSVCAGGSITATNISSGEVNDFTFTVLDSDGSVVLTSSDSPATFTFGEDLPVGEYIVRLEVSSPTCAPVSNSTRVRLGALPSIALDPQEDMCGPGQVQLSATYSDPAGINFINWQIRDEAGRLIYNSDAYAPPVTYLLEGIYHVTATVANECGVNRSRDTFQLFEAPIPSFTLESEVACQGGTLTVTNTSGGDVTDFSFSLIDPMGTTILTSSASPASFAIGESLPDGDYTLRLSAGTPECGMETAETTITVGGAPTVELVVEPDYCGPTTVTLDAASTGATGMSWLVTDEAGTTVFESNVPDAPTLNLAPGTYAVTATATSDCGTAIARDTFRIYEGPTPAFTVDSDVVCQGGTLTATNTSSGDVTDYTFSLVDPTGTTILTSSASPAKFAIGENLPKGEYTLILSAGNPECGMKEARKTIKIGGVPVIDLATSPDYCGPSAVALSAAVSGAKSVAWQVTNSAGAMVFESNIPDGPTLNLVPGTYAVAVTATSDCGIAIERDTFRIYPEPVADIQLSANDLCLSAGNTVTVRNGSSDDELSYVWSVTPAGSVSIDDDRAATPTFTFSGEGSYELTAEISNPTCDPITWTGTVEVRESVEVVLANQDRFCERLDLTPVVVYGGAKVDSVRWSFPGSVGDMTSREEYPTGIPYRDAGTFVYELTVFNACGVTTVADTIHIDAMPELVMGDRDTVCILDGLYALSSPTPEGGSWADAAGRNGIVTAGGKFDPVAAGLGLTVLEYTFTNGACMVTGSREVLVIEEPEVAVSEPVLDACVSDTYFVLSNGNPTGGWYEGPGVIDPSGVMDPSSLGAGTYTLTYYYRPAGMTCTGSVDFTVNVRPGPIAQIDAPDYVCIGEPVQFKQTGTGGVRYVWRNSDEPPVRVENPVFTFGTPGIHTVTLTAYNEFGCAHEVVKHINATGTPVARFEKEQAEACDGVPFTFYNNSQVFGEAAYLWDFGNGRTSNNENPAPVLFERGSRDTTYQVSLTVTNDCGTHTYTDAVTITTNPVAAFELSEENGCSQLNVTFDNQTAGTRNRYKWFVNGELYSIEATPPSRSFIAEGNANASFEIMLVAYNACGSDTLTRTVVSKPNELRVRFSADERTGCDPFTVQFRNFSSPDSLVTYAWDFGDGYSSDEKEPEHTFRNTTSEVKTFNVTLVADNGCARDEITLPVTVYPAPDVSFEVASATCVGDSVFFENTSGRVTDLVWTFGDGTTIKDVEAPGHVFPGPGEYTVTLSASVEGADCPGVFSRKITIRTAPQVDLTADNVMGCPPLQVDLTNLTESGSFFSWNFGDGNTAVGAEPRTHTYTTPGTYEITLTVRDEFGCSNDAVFSSVEVHDVPEVKFAAEASEACGVPQAVCFTNQTTGAQGYSWDFGNGLTSGLNTPCITYTEADTYNVTLEATNEFGCKAAAAAPLAIYGQPVAEFSIPDTATCVSGDLPFTSESSNTDFIKWTFSDGYTTEGASFNRSFEEPGFYDVTVIAGNGSGCADTTTFQNFVEIFPRPFADFDFDNAEGEAMNTIQFFDRSSADAVRFAWDFGDGYGSEELNPVHRYLSGFDKTVYHWVENEYGCQDTAAANVDLDMLVGLFVPNIFTPEDNTVAEQDVFKPKGIGLEDYYIAVYTRTGQLVWESEAIDAEGSPTEAWDGTFQGRPAKPGTYVWRVHRAKFRNGRGWTGMANETGTIAKTGYVTLLR